MADQNLLTYSFQPSSVFISTIINMKLVIENPPKAEAVNFGGIMSDDFISIIFPFGAGDTALVKNLDFVCPSPPDNFTCTRSAGDDDFNIKANKTTKIQPGQRLEFMFESVPINDTYDQTSPNVFITIKEYLGDNTCEGRISITKQANNALSIFAWADPSTIALNAVTNLYWQSVGGTSVEVGPFKSGDKIFKVSGQPPYPGITKIGIPSGTVPQYTYTLKVFTNDRNFDVTTVPITQNQPLITTYSADKGKSLKADESVMLEWFFLWGSSSVINSNTGFQWNAPLSPLKVSPGLELQLAYQTNYASMPSSVYFELAVNGFEKPAKERITFDIQLIILKYFKFITQDGDKLSGISLSFDQPNWKAYKLDTQGADLTVLTLYQPGSKTERYYLGKGDKVHPQIEYFSYTDKGSGNYELSWITLNLKSLVLAPGDYTVPAGEIDKGSKTVSLTANTVYTLKGTAANNEEIISVLEVIVSK